MFLVRSINKNGMSTSKTFAPKIKHWLSMAPGIQIFLVEVMGAPEPINAHDWTLP